MNFSKSGCFFCYFIIVESIEYGILGERPQICKAND